MGVMAERIAYRREWSGQGGHVIPSCSQMVAQAFQPVQAQAKACGYIYYLYDRNLV
jgi:hypothetical protein